MADVIDFSDLGNSVFFSYKDTKYEIPAVTNKKAKILFSMGTKAKDEVDTEEVGEFQSKYVCAAVKNTTTNKYLEEKDIEEWPMALTNKVIQLINNSISASFSEESEEGKKS